MHAAIELALAWKFLEHCDQWFRCFGGQIFQEETDEPSGRIQWINFKSQPDWEITDRIARSRVQEFCFQVSGQILLQSMEITENRSVLPPKGFLDKQEYSAGYLLKALLHFNIFGDRKEYNGLQLNEWLRAYSWLKYVCRNPEPESLALNELFVCLEKTKFLHALSRFGLTPEKASHFCDLITFSKASGDLFDAPLLKCENDLYFLFRPPVLSLNIPIVILSQLASLNEEVGDKGTQLETWVRELFRNNDIRCERIKFSRNGQQYECDAVVLWEKKLILFECKNYALSKSVLSSYYFKEKMEDAVSQVLRLKNALESYPETIRAAFGDNATWTEIVPCVLNGLPWSCGEFTNRVFIYDSICLDRFFDNAEITIREYSNGNETGRQTISRIWKGAAPAVDDLLDQMAEPVQVKILRPFNQIQEFALLLSSTHGIKFHFIIDPSVLGNQS